MQGHVVQGETQGPAQQSRVTPEWMGGWPGWGPERLAQAPPRAQVEEVGRFSCKLRYMPDCRPWPCR